ncbi:MAG TPA: tRNA (adenine-N1)-methyltransferase [Actinomycetota bacterium]|nr:tRNA (adenine-N1)-methyltransferase [Actinomycetota bacterium]
MSPPLEPGEQVLLIDQRDRTYLFSLEPGAVFHTHAGTLRHDELIGRPEGTRVTTARGMVLTAFRPRFADYVLKMPRGAQVVYPKDLGPIVISADVFPGARVLEAGTGSGALTIALCRAVGERGRVVSYEVRPEHRERAAANVEGFFGKLPDQLELREGDVADVGESPDRFDRVVFDLAEPWAPLGGIRSSLEAGAVLCAYLPTTGQVQQLVLALPEAGFLHLETFEVLKRSWHVTERSVRPDHRMVGHTGFLVVARVRPPG